MLFIDLDGCPYCTKMLNESFFAKNQTSDFIKKHFDVINLNVKGDREVTWDQNTTLSEKDLAIRLGIEYSPTVLFLDENKKLGYFILIIITYKLTEFPVTPILMF